jgi:outer membrane protein OmpA-like peptidoglycan-associated protein
MADPAPETTTPEANQTAQDGGRICSPGERTFDGCNWTMCRQDGSGWQTTLKNCEIKITLQVQFESGSWALSEDQRDRLREASTQLRLMLEPPERRIVVVGHVLRSESTAQEKLRQIATRRAEAVRKALVQAGLPKERLTSKTAPPSDGTSDPPTWRVVTFELEPNRPYSSDVTPDAGIR